MTDAAQKLDSTTARVAGELAATVPVSWHVTEILTMTSPDGRSRIEAERIESSSQDVEGWSVERRQSLSNRLNGFEFVDEIETEQLDRPRRPAFRFKFLGDDPDHAAGCGVSILQEEGLTVTGFMFGGEPDSWLEIEELVSRADVVATSTAVSRSLFELTSDVSPAGRKSRIDDGARLRITSDWSSIRAAWRSDATATEIGPSLAVTPEELSIMATLSGTATPVSLGLDWFVTLEPSARAGVTTAALRSLLARQIITRDGAGQIQPTEELRGIMAGLAAPEVLIEIDRLDGDEANRTMMFANTEHCVEIGVETHECRTVRPLAPAAMLTIALADVPAAGKTEQEPLTVSAESLAAFGDPGTEPFSPVPGTDAAMTVTRTFFRTGDTWQGSSMRWLTAGDEAFLVEERDDDTLWLRSTGRSDLRTKMLEILPGGEGS